MKHCLCILGWHFCEDFYTSLASVPGDKHIICHRPREFVARLAWLRTECRTYLCENRGLDWGGYHQFNAMGFWESHDFVVYCHDDLVIKDARFADAVAERFANPSVMVVGNGNNGSDTEFRLGKYNARLGIDDSDDFMVRTVRGSFLAVRSEVFRRIGNFPVHWKTERKIEKGNRSLRRFGYHVTKQFGREAITYLGPTSWLDTTFLIELRRGELVNHSAAVR
jgi:hypothetical protein